MADFARGRLEDGIKTLTAFMAAVEHQENICVQKIN